MDQTLSSFAGVERRQNAVFVTSNTEYHVRRGRVVAVRRRGDRDWSRGHMALRMKIDGHVDPAGLIPLPGPPCPGQRLYLAREGKNVVTSRVVSIERAPKETVEEYPADNATPKPD